MSSYPSWFRSAILTPVHQSRVIKPASLVISINRFSPWLIYNLQLTWLPVKKISFNPSLLKSPMPTPPPMYPNSLIKEKDESLSYKSFANKMFDFEDGSFVNRYLSSWPEQATSHIITDRKKRSLSKRVNFFIPKWSNWPRYIQSN